jgi:hypothetical protein
MAVGASVSATLLLMATMASGATSTSEPARTAARVTPLQPKWTVVLRDAAPAVGTVAPTTLPPPVAATDAPPLTTSSAS